MPPEIGGREPRLRVALDLLVEAGIAIGEVLERDVEVRVQRAIERRGARRIRAHRRIRRTSYTMSWFVPQPLMWYARITFGASASRSLHPLLREAATRARPAPPAEVAPEIGLDVHHDRLRAVDAREEQLDVAPVRRHGARVPHVRQVRVLLVAAARLRLQHHVVAEDRRHRRATTSPARTSTRTSRRVPRRPALARVDPAGEVLVTEAERRRRAQRSRSVGLVGHADLQRARPVRRQVRQRRRGRARSDGRREHGETRDRPESFTPGL